MLEVVIRMVLIYALLIIAMRLMGKRVAAQMSVSELAVIVTLGAAVGVPMQVPDRDADHDGWSGEFSRQARRAG